MGRRFPLDYGSLLLGVAVTVCSGCAWPGSWGLPWSRQEPTPAISSSDDLTKYKHPAATSEPSSPMQALAAAWPFKKSPSQLNAESAKKAQSIPPGDPLSLQYTPQRLGPEVYVKAAKLYEVQNNVPGAVQNYQRALEVNPRNEEALVGYARLCDRQGKFEQATQVYQRAIEANPEAASIHNDLAICLSRQGQWAASLQAMQRAIQLEPREPLYRNNMAKILVQSGRDQEALQHLSAVLPPPAAHYNLGYLLYENGRADLAQPHFAQAVRLEPRFAEAAKMLQVVQNTASAPRGGAPIVAGPQNALPQRAQAPVNALAQPQRVPPTGPVLAPPHVDDGSFSRLPTLPRTTATPQQPYANNVNSTRLPDPAPPVVEMPR